MAKHLLCAACHTGPVRRPSASEPHFLHHLQQCLKQQQEQVENTRLQVWLDTCRADVTPDRTFSSPMLVQLCVARMASYALFQEGVLA